MKTYRFSERKSNLSSESMEEVSRRAKVTNKPVYLVKLLDLKVIILRLEEKL